MWGDNQVIPSYPASVVCTCGPYWSIIPPAPCPIHGGSLMQPYAYPWWLATIYNTTVYNPVVLLPPPPDYNPDDAMREI